MTPNPCWTVGGEAVHQIHGEGGPSSELMSENPKSLLGKLFIKHEDYEDGLVEEPDDQVHVGDEVAVAQVHVAGRWDSENTSDSGAADAEMRNYCSTHLGYGWISQILMEPHHMNYA